MMVLLLGGGGGGGGRIVSFSPYPCCPLAHVTFLSCIY